MGKNLVIKLNKKTHETMKNDPFFEGLGKYKKVIVFSSHLDDAVLSTGSLISYLGRKKIDIQVCSIFTKAQEGRSQSIDTILMRAGFKDSKTYIQARKDEDKKALRSLGVTAFKHLDFIDAAWRIDENGEHLYPSSQIGTVSGLDQNIRNEVEAKIEAYTSLYSNAVFLAPLARGNHIDHQIVRDAVTKILNNVVYYEDFPYSGKFDNQDSFINEQMLGKHVFSSALEEKKDAILLYKTQQESFRVFLDGSFLLSEETYYSA